MLFFCVTFLSTKLGEKKKRTTATTTNKIQLLIKMINHNLDKWINKYIAHDIFLCDFFSFIEEVLSSSDHHTFFCRKRIFFSSFFLWNGNAKIGKIPFKGINNKGIEIFPLILNTLRRFALLPIINDIRQSRKRKIYAYTF